jgi:DNA gyrase inhibitor GyrI
MQVKIVTVEPVTLAVLEHRGDPVLVNDSVQRFITRRKETGLSPITNSQTYGIAYDDPTTTPAKDFRFDICGAVAAPVPANRHGVVTKTIPGGRCAVVRHEGSPDHIAGSIYHLYRNSRTRPDDATNLTVVVSAETRHMGCTMMVSAERDFPPSGHERASCLPPVHFPASSIRHANLNNRWTHPKKRGRIRSLISLNIDYRSRRARCSDH